MEAKLHQPKDLAKICKVNKSTLNGYLKDAELFPPTRVDENNGFRYYNNNTVEKLFVFKALKKRPFRLTETEIKAILIKYDVIMLYKLYNESNAALHKFLLDNKCL